MQWNTERVLDVLASHIPLLVTDIARRSLLKTSEVAAAIDEGARTEGSSCASFFTQHARWSQSGRGADAHTTLRLDVMTAHKARLVLPGRLPFGESLTLQSREHTITFEPDDAPALLTRDEHLTLRLCRDSVADVASSLKAGTGVFAVPGFSGVTVEIEPTVIRDNDDNVTDVIG